MKMKLWISVLTAAMTAICHAQTNFNIITPNPFVAPFHFAITNTPGIDPAATNPTITISAGATYTFTINTAAGFHPVDINTNTSFPFASNAFAGASPQNISSGTITLTIPPTNFPTTLYYICTVHGFFGQINVTPPAATPPPPNTIVSIVLSPTNVTITSTGTTTTYAFVPQFSSNLVNGTWLDVSNFANITNSFDGATNTTVFDRLDAICGSNVFIRISQEPPQ